jgi:hypothetical protein
MAAVVALSGRRIDATESEPAFPLHHRETVAAAIRNQLQEIDARVLVCSAASGADLLALEAAGALGIRRRILLPFPLQVFRNTSVADRPGDWGPLFDRICDEVMRAGDLVVLGRDPDSQAVYSETVRAILSDGDAIGATSGFTDRLAVAVWDGPRREGQDVTRDFLNEARRRHWPIAEISTR